MKKLAFALLVFGLAGCATTHIGSLTVAEKDGTSLTVSNYVSGRDLELTKTKDGWTVRAVASSATKAMYDGLGPLLGTVVRAAAEGANPAPKVAP